MWFQLQLNPFLPPLSILVGEDGHMYVKLVDIGLLLQKSNPYSYRNGMKHLAVQGKDILPTLEKIPPKTLEAHVVPILMAYQLIHSENMCLADLFHKRLMGGVARKQRMKKYTSREQKGPLLVCVDEADETCVPVNMWIQQFIRDLQLYREEVRKHYPSTSGDNVKRKLILNPLEQLKRARMNVGTFPETFSESVSQAEATQPMPQAEATVPVPQAEATEPVSQAEATVPVSQPEATEHVPQAEATEHVPQPGPSSKVKLDNDIVIDDSTSPNNTMETENDMDIIIDDNPPNIKEEPISEPTVNVQIKEEPIPEPTVNVHIKEEPTSEPSVEPIPGPSTEPRVEPTLEPSSTSSQEPPRSRVPGFFVNLSNVPFQRSNCLFPGPGDLIVKFHTPPSRVYFVLGEEDALYWVSSQRN